MAQFRAVTLCIVSSPGQTHEDRYSMPEQIEMTAAAAERLDARVVRPFAFQHSRWFKTIEGLCESSPEYAEFIGLVTAGAIDLVILAQCDRIGRTSIIQLLVIDYLWDHDVQVYSIAEPFGDPVPPDVFRREGPTPMQRQYHAMLAQQSDAYIRMFVENARRGRHGRARRGLPLNYANPPYGYRHAGEDKRPHVIVPGEARWVRRIGEMRAQGDGSATIARTVTDEGCRTRSGHPFTTGQILRMVKNPFYAGFIRYIHWSRHHDERRRVILAEELFDGQHKAIWPADTWAAIQRVNARNTRDYPFPGGNGATHLLTGLAKCGYCGGFMAYGVSNYKYPMLRCGSPSRTRSCPGGTNYHNAAATHAQVRDQVRYMIENPNAMREVIDARATGAIDNGEIDALEASLADIDRRQDRLLQALETGKYPVARLTARQEALDAERETLELRLADLRTFAANTTAMLSTLDSLRPHLATWDAMPEPDARRVLLALAERVILKKGSPPEIVWRTG